MKENMKSRRGVALAEAVIALVVIGVISVATLTIIFGSVQIENKTIVAMDVRNQAENAIECFRFAKGDKNVFFACLEKIAEGERCNFAKNDTEFILDMGGYKMRITVREEMQEMQDENGNTVQKAVAIAFDFAAIYENNNDMIYSFTFPSNEGGSEQ